MAKFTPIPDSPPPKGGNRGSNQGIRDLLDKTPGQWFRVAEFGKGQSAAGSAAGYRKRGYQAASRKIQKNGKVLFGVWAMKPVPENGVLAKPKATKKG